MHDRKINTTFNTADGLELCVIEEKSPCGCDGCYYWSKGAKMCQNDPDRIHTGECSMERRIDKQGVIFVKAEGGDND